MTTTETMTATPHTTPPETRAPEQYAVLIIGDADRWWTTMSQEERSAGYATYGRFAQALAARGHRVLGGGIEVRRVVREEERVR